MGITIASRSRKWTKGAQKMWRETPGKGIEWRGKKANFVLCVELWRNECEEVVDKSAERVGVGGCILPWQVWAESRA